MIPYVPLAYSLTNSSLSLMKLMITPNQFIKVIFDEIKNQNPDLLLMPSIVLSLSLKNTERAKRATKSVWKILARINNGFLLASIIERL